MSALSNELRHMRREIARLHRKHALARVPIKITDVRQKDGDWQVQGELGEDPKTGKKVLTPWVRVQPASSGELKIKVKPSKGQQMYLHSTSGVVGADSLAIWGAFDQDHPAPEGEDDLIIERGKTRIVLNDKTITQTAPDAVTASSGDSKHEVKPSKIGSTSKKIFTEGRTFLGSEQAMKVVDLTDGLPCRKVFGV